MLRKVILLLYLVILLNYCLATQNNNDSQSLPLPTSSNNPSTTLTGPLEVEAQETTEQLNSSVPKRWRKFSKEKVDVLSEAFKESASLANGRKEQVTQKAWLTPKQVTDWFEREKKRKRAEADETSKGLLCLQQLNSSVPKRSWRKFSKEKVDVLREAFKESSSLANSRKEQVSQEAGLTPPQVADWFEREKRKTKRKSADDGFDRHSIQDTPFYSPQRSDFSAHFQDSPSNYYSEGGLIDPYNLRTPPRSPLLSVSQTNSPSLHLEEGSIDIADFDSPPTLPLPAHNEAPSSTVQLEEGPTDTYQNPEEGSIDISDFDSPPTLPLPAHNEAPSSTIELEENATEIYQNPEQLNSSVPKRSWQKFSKEEVHVLREAFKESSYLPEGRKEEVAQETGLTPKQITNWFQREKIKKKRKRAEAEQLSSSVTKPSWQRFSKEHLHVLREAFKESSYLTKDRKEKVAQEAGLTPQQVADWFEREKRRVPAKSAEEDERSKRVLSSELIKTSVRKSRKRFSKEEKSLLLNAFEVCPYLDDNRTDELSRQLGINRKQVMDWFYNHRRKVGRNNTKAEDKAHQNNATETEKPDHGIEMNKAISRDSDEKLKP